MAPVRRLLALSAALAGVAHGVAPSPPCYSPLQPAYEAICYSTVAAAGNVSIRLVGATVDAALITGESPYTNFTTGSEASAAGAFQYFGGDNMAFERIPVTSPLIFRPAPTGTWLASIALPTSLIPKPAAAPAFTPGSDLLLEAWGPSGSGPGRTIAAYQFYSIQLATAAQYAAACASLAAALPGMGYAPVPGSPWAEAWVTYSVEAIVGDRINECWAEVQPQRMQPQQQAGAPPAGSSASLRGSQ